MRSLTLRTCFEMSATGCLSASAEPKQPEKHSPGKQARGTTLECPQLISKHVLTATLAVFLAVASSASALDTVKLTSGKTMSGEITAMDSQTVTMKVLSKTKTIAVKDIVTISYDDAPASLNLARLAALGGRYEDALKTLNKLDTDELSRDLVKQDVEFYKGLCAAQLALSGRGEIQEAGKMMNVFVRSYPQNYHWLEANRLVGDLLVANKSFGLAIPYYEKLAKTPWPDYHITAQVAIGEAKLAEGKIQEAQKSFQSALDTKASGKASEAQKRHARLGLARCLVEENKTDEAVKLVQDIILNTDPENSTLLAKAYNTLGTALRKAGKPNDALLAFLHVDLLYFSLPEQHAEALANLVELWTEVHRPQRAIEARRTLNERYKNSRWSTR